MARKKEPGTEVPADLLKQDDLAKLLRDSEAADPFEEAAQQRLGRMIAEIAARQTKKRK